jgi:molecular chaperone HtpG
VLTDEKFWDRAKKFMLVKNVDGKYFTLDEYEQLVKPNQTDKNDTKVYLYATDKTAQFTYIENAKAKGYDVLLLDGQLDVLLLTALSTKSIKPVLPCGTPTGFASCFKRRTSEVSFQR